MRRISRRNFMGSVGAAAALSVSARAVRGSIGERIRLGLIGCGWWGTRVLEAAHHVGGVETVALCDVDSAHLDQVAETVAQLQERPPAKFKDYREMLGGSDMDAVIIGTPPHWHALQFIAACRRGLHVYCEKPLSYDVREGQAMVREARKAGNVVQVGFQRRQTEAVRQAADFIRSGGAGRILQVEAQIHYAAEPRDTTVQEPPATLDWDFWCGPAPLLPYRPSIGHFAWRLEKEYGHGHLVDWGIHWIDAIRNVLDLGMPRRVQAAGGLYVLEGAITTPDILTATWEFEDLPVTWRHRIWGAAEYDPTTANGIFFFGEKATVFVNDGRWEVVPRGQGGERQVHEVRSEKDPLELHVAEFLAAVRGEGRVSCPVREAFQSTTAVHLAMIALESESVVRWHPGAEEILDNPRAAALLRRPYRQPWRHPYDES
ncbi:MAG: Gfo/Idh/MocA family oxidoreductase [Acidobacteriota bacterium]